ncbi:cytochrome bc1 complex Rieske iron-sulfur subunit [Pseudonocardia dioxanivorans]|uniref:cytochrome bc1 complex Rieske iron-sulfur subunit n=1 Tax=Pseudonocardia dioxanivorans TaxID=240495 RepID=UPI000CD1BAA1|nr:Rieske 2Fe-2S domain-containing protein [Pseudonocardia dioxanivorans]
MSGATTGEGGVTSAPTAAELEEMTPEQLARLAGDLDDVDVQHNAPKFPVPGTRAEKRAERAVAGWFTLSALSALAFVIAFIWWPHEYVAPDQPGYRMYSLYTPVVGVTFGLAVLALGIGVISYVKKFFPSEVSVQQRHDGPSDEVARRTVMAQLAAAGKDTTIARRTVIKRSAGAAAGLFGIGLGIAAIGPLIRNPWKDGPNSPLWITGWKSTNGETVYMRADTGDLEDIRRVRPEDMEPGSMQTVFPYRLSEQHDEEALIKAQKAGDAPVMLIRLRPGTKVVKRAGQENFNYGDYYAFSKICTHLGCPTSLYEAQDNRILCPCHQSQFLATEYARPVFGPATRALPQLPITVDDEGYFIATSDFHEAVGPAFWERRS